MCHRQEILIKVERMMSNHTKTRIKIPNGFIMSKLYKNMVPREKDASHRKSCPSELD